MRVNRLLPFAAFALLSIVSFSGCSYQDMQDQPRYSTYQENNFFPDGRSERPIIPGTVARGHLHDDDLFYAGKVDGKEATVFPFPITEDILKRGHERYDIYCSVCHDRSGSGRGMIVRRGFPPPPSYHSDRLRQAPVGHFFDVITNGFGVMFAYKERITPEDRWAIVAYIRALQRSQNATMKDVPDEQRKQLEAVPQ